MWELAVFDDLAELRDAVLILVAAVVCVVAFVGLLIVTKLSLIALRVVRRLQRFHDNRIDGAIESADAKLALWMEEERWSARGLLELLQLARAEVRRRRQPPPQPGRWQRLIGLLPTVRR